MIPTDSEIGRRADLFKVASDVARLRIMYLLGDRELTAAQLRKALGQAALSTSYHLRLLRVSSMVQTRRAGQNSFYSLTDLGRTVTSFFE
jgi:DNA-binding transcriptional ArsR family regulator